MSGRHLRTFSIGSSPSMQLPADRPTPPWRQTYLEVEESSHAETEARRRQPEEEPDHLLTFVEKLRILDGAELDVLPGTWAYAAERSRKYRISKTKAGSLIVDEHLPSGTKVFGMLRPTDQWLQAELRSSDGKQLGMMRLRFAADQGVIVSNVKNSGAAAWSADIIAHKDDGGEAIAKAAEQLSNFFDSVATSTSAAPTCGTAARLVCERSPTTIREVVAVPADTAAGAGSARDPLGPFGYVVNRLEAARQGGGLVCAEATPMGVPLLVLPLQSCWTAQAAKADCPTVAEALSEAAQRNPQSKLLQADATWIALHLLHEKSMGAAATPHRRAHIALLPDAFETLLAWSGRDLESLHGSRWKEGAKQRQAQVGLDYRTLAAELGPEVVSKLGLSEDRYQWARQAIQQFGMTFQTPDGSNLELLAPGMEFLEPDSDTIPSAEDTRLEFGLNPAPALVVYASRNFQPGDSVALSHGGLVCGNGFRLLGGGQLVEANPLDYAEIHLKLPVLADNLVPNAQFWRILESLEAGLKRTWRDPKLGECLPPERAEDQSLVRVAEGKRGPEVRVHIRLTSSQLLPDKGALADLGVVILADRDRLEKAISEERDVVNVFGADASEHRALTYLSKRLKWALEEYPSRPDADASRLEQNHPRGPLPRRAKGLRVVAAERQILEDAIQELKFRLEQNMPSPWDIHGLDCEADVLTAELAALPAGSEPEQGTQLGRHLAQLRGCTQALEQVRQRYRSLLSEGQLDVAAGKAVKEELTVLGQLLSGSPLGPMAAASMPARETTDVAVHACGQAYVAALNAMLASCEWEVAHAQRSGSKEQQEKAFMAQACVRLRLTDFAGALGDFKQVLAITPADFKDPASPANAAMGCAMTVASHSDRVLDLAGKNFSDAWKGCGPTLRALREKMRNLGYMQAGLQWPQPTRVPPLDNLARAFEATWAPEREVAEMMGTEGLAALEGKPWWWRVDGVERELRLMIDLFILHRTLTLKKTVELLGPDACKLMLERSALSCYVKNEAKLLEPSEAVKLVSASKKEDGPDVFSNIVLYPVEEDLLVALDFDQDVCVEGGFEPVLYLGEDSRALVAGTPHKSPAKLVLDPCCGSGAQGFVALKRYAEKVVFVDSNPRALRFACFSSYLNSLEDKATFREGSILDDFPKEAEGPYDAVVAGLPFLPNPSNVITNGGPIYAGGSDGERFLAAVVTNGSKMLAKGGWLAATAMVGNIKGLAQRIENWVGDAGGFHVTVFRGEPKRILEDFLPASTPRCPEVQRIGYGRGLYHEAGLRSMSEVLLLMCARPTGSGTSQGVVQPEHRNLWLDVDYLRAEVPATLEKQLILAGGDEPLYDLDWADAKAADKAPAEGRVSPALAQAVTPWKGRKPRPAKKESALAVKDKGIEGATWADIMLVNQQGFSPPVLCNVLWKEAPSQLPGTLSGKGVGVPHVYQSKRSTSNIKICLMELEGCPCPTSLKESLQFAQVKDAIRFDGNTGIMRLYKDYFWKGLGNATKPILRDYDVLFIPIAGWRGGYRGSSMVDLPSEVLKCLQVLFHDAEKRTHPQRIFILTNGCFGPNAPPDHIDVAAPIAGMIRSARIEMPQVPILWMDTDCLGGSELTQYLLQQLTAELDHATPPGGLQSVGQKERAKALLANNRDVAWRLGKRYLPRVDLSPRMPIYAGREAPPLPRAVAESVQLVTGGVGGLGYLAAEALVECGARRLVLTSRTGEAPPGQEGKIQELRQMGAEVFIEKCELSRVREVQKLLEKIRMDYGRLAVVVHAAGMLDDKSIKEQDINSLRAVFEPKAQGAMNLHSNTLEDDLHAFVLFSSTCALRGGAGQANYSAANVYVDEVARSRVAMGLPAVSVQWPAVDLSRAARPSAKTGAESSISVGVAKQVIKQLICGTEKIEPVQAVLTEAQLVPTTPAVASLLMPLLARMNN